MSRAAQNQYQQDQSAGNTLRGTLGTQAGDINAQAQQIQNVTPAVAAAEQAQLTSGTAASFGQGRQRASDTAARTGSLAGLQEVNANLTRGQAQQNATNTQQLQQNIWSQNNAAAQQRANVYSMGAQPTEAALSSVTGVQAPLTSQAYAPGIMGQLGNSFASGFGGNLGKYLGGG